ncbi:MAG TPA: 2-dehydropantoate 2-reductase [Anaerolineae bacterium]
MKIIVVGAGAIGGYVGARLALAGHAVTFLGRQPLAQAVSARGLRLIEPGRERETRDGRVVTSVEEAFAYEDRFDLALFTVKTFGTQRAIDELRPYRQRIDRCLSLQNGVSSENLLGEAFGREKIIAGTILNPVSIREPGVVVLEKRKGGVGLSQVSTNQPANPPTNQLTSQPTNPLAFEEITAQLRRAGFSVRTYADYRSMKWSKLLLNLIGNASSAILDLNTMQVFADKRLFAIEVAALREAMRVARAIGVRFVSLPGYPVPLLVTAARWLPLPLLQPVLIPLVAKGRGSKMPSLHIDLHSGKPCSEIDELNGVVVRVGMQAKIPTPANALLTETFQAVQTGKANRAEWRYRAERLWTAYCKPA